MRWSVCFAVLALMSAAPVHAEFVEAKTINVTGSAVKDVKPDFATVDIGVFSSDKITVKAVADNAALMANVVTAIRALGVPDSAMQTSNFSIAAMHPSEKNGYGEDYSVTLGYAVNNTLTITLDDTNKVARVIDAAVKAGANTSNSVSFGVKDRKAFDDEVLVAAMKDARHKAEVLAKAENAKVGKMLSVNDSRMEPGFYPASLAAPSSLARTVVMPGEVSVAATVTVTYALE